MQLSAGPAGITAESICKQGDAIISQKGRRHEAILGSLLIGTHVQSKDIVSLTQTFVPAIHAHLH